MPFSQRSSRSCQISPEPIALGCQRRRVSHRHRCQAQQLVKSVVAGVTSIRVPCKWTQTQLTGCSLVFSRALKNPVSITSSWRLWNKPDTVV